ncbi:hypothetical protein GCM10007216_27700 [Thalassobacillus devorans]|uniref:DUF1453 domain-containing protein n=2 Tax=Thalassobacillus devorans TaxID=279813 RepID=A0ABQ1PE76_9BACI|nr:hypothetical protein GCM10007216_27700 [Thalassobacillus devorans]
MALFPNLSLMNKLLLQLLLPIAAIYWINKNRYWFHHYIQKTWLVCSHPLGISIVFLVLTGGYDLLVFTSTVVWVLPVLQLLMFASSFLFWSMFLGAGRNTNPLSLGERSLYLVVNMLVLGVYAFIASHYFPSHITGIYTFIGSIVVVMTFLLGYTLMMWGRKEHVVDRRTVEGLVRKLK